MRKAFSFKRSRISMLEMEMKVQLYTFLNPTLGGRDWSVPVTGHFAFAFA
jgi:hypothetical protein